MNFLRRLQRDPAGENYRWFDEKLEPYMLALSVIFVPVVLGPLLSDLSSESERSLLAIGTVVWALFAMELALLLWLAPSRLAALKSHRLDALIVLLPMLRPLRMIGIARLATSATGIGRAISAMRRVCGRSGMTAFFSLVMACLVLGAGFALIFEHGQDGATIQDYPRALWWAFVTITTVGYGDHAPITGGGQIVAATLMLVGIGGLSLVTASVAALFVDDDAEDDMSTTMDEVAALRADIARLESLVRELAPTDRTS